MDLPAYSVVIDYVSEGEVANLVRGYVELKGKKVRFSGVAYGRFGGQNFAPDFAKTARDQIASLTGDFAKFEEDLQQRLVRGEFEAKPGKDQHHHHQHLGESGPQG
jgi:hypothetical protein